MRRWIVLAFGLGIGLWAAYALLSESSKSPRKLPPSSSTAAQPPSTAAAEPPRGEIREASRARLRQILREADREEESEP